MVANLPPPVRCRRTRRSGGRPLAWGRAGALRGQALDREGNAGIAGGARSHRRRGAGCPIRARGKGRDGDPGPGGSPHAGRGAAGRAIRALPRRRRGRGAVGVARAAEPRAAGVLLNRPPWWRRAVGRRRRREHGVPAAGPRRDPEALAMRSSALLDPSAGRRAGPAPPSAPAPPFSSDRLVARRLLEIYDREATACVRLDLRTPVGVLRRQRVARIWPPRPATSPAVLDVAGPGCAAPSPPPAPAGGGRHRSRDTGPTWARRAALAAVPGRRLRRDQGDELRDTSGRWPRARRCRRVLRPGGTLVITVPSSLSACPAIRRYSLLTHSACGAPAADADLSR